MSSQPELHPILYDPVLRQILAEDLGTAGDVTTDAIVPATQTAVARVVARKAGRLAGLGVAERAFQLLDGTIATNGLVSDGDDFDAGATLLELSGAARTILTAERTALNLLGRMCGIATATRTAVEAVAGTKAQIVCTRKTMPGLRVFDKYAVRAGGGHNHRFGLYDAVLIKDNHIAAAGGLPEAVAAVRRHAGHMTKIEVEVDTLDQLTQLLPLEVDAVLLDNMAPEIMTEAVAMVGGACLTEASGGITPDTARAVAETGVDLISLGWLTHSVTNLDIGLDFVD